MSLKISRIESSKILMANMCIDWYFLSVCRHIFIIQNDDEEFRMLLEIVTIGLLEINNDDNCDSSLVTVA